MSTTKNQLYIVTNIDVCTCFVFAIFSDEPNSTRLQFLQNREKEIHDELLSTVIRVIEPQLKHFNELIRNPPKVCNTFFYFIMI